MARTKRFLNGAAKDAFLRQVLAAEPGLDEETRERLALALQSSIALVSLRHHGAPDSVRADVPVETRNGATAHESEALDATGSGPGATATEREPFDPYSPNVIVVFRTLGRDAALAELHAIEDVECLRLLAREQRLGIASDLANAADIRHAIVAAAERRVANRRAAAS
jgi:hypothetical protein